jgi:hypothetical protein
VVVTTGVSPEPLNTEPDSLVAGVRMLLIQVKEQTPNIARSYSSVIWFS